MDKKALNERDICTKYITPAIVNAGWDVLSQIREEVSLTHGRIIVRGKMHMRGKSKRADYVLFHKPNIPIAVIEAKDNKQPVGSGMQQAIDYAKMLDVPFAYSSNGDAFLEHDMTASSGKIETEIPLDRFPSPKTLWQRYRIYKGFDTAIEPVVTKDYYTDSSEKIPRYYQLVAINRTVEAIAKGANR